jgi:hypothetical protein
MNRQDIGFPEVANLYRTKGTGLSYNKTYLLPRGDIIPLGEDNAFYKGWMDYNRNALMDKLYNADQSLKRNLEPRYPQLPKSGNKAQVLFGVHNDDMQMIRDHQNQIKMSGGGLKLSDSTAGVGMSKKDSEKERLRIINRLRRDYEGEATVEQPPEAQDLTMGREDDEKLQFDLNIASISERVQAGIIDNSVYNSLLNVSSYLVKNIWKFDDTGYFVSIIKALEFLKSEIEAFDKSYRNNQLGRLYSKQNIQLATASLRLLDRLIEYVENNMRGVGREERFRKSLAKSTIKGFKELTDPLIMTQQKLVKMARDPNYEVPDIYPDMPPQEPEGTRDARQLYPVYPSQVEPPPLAEGSGKRRKRKVNKRLIKLY